MTGKSETVSFRLDHDMINPLSRCADLEGVSKGEYAKRLVLDGLKDTFAETAKSLLLAIRHDLSLLREEHLTSTNALLVTAGKMTPDKAIEFIDRVMLKKPDPEA